MKETKFKYTEIGYIPNDWEVKPLGEICDVRDGTHDTPKYQINGYCFITSKNLVDGKIDFSNVQYISKFDYDKINERSKVDLYDILFAMIGTIGNPVIVVEEPNFAIKNIALFKNIGKVNQFFLRSYLSSMLSIKRMDDDANGSNQKFLSLNYFRHYLIPLPPLPEQRRIAAAFSDIDTLIQKLEILIQKKQNIKQGAMQSLLTGKKRLKGFEGEWCEKKLGEIAELINGRAYRQDELLSNGKYKVLRVGNFFSNDSWYYSDLELPNKLYCHSGDLLYAWSCTYGAYIWTEDNTIFHYHIWKVECNNVEKKFLYYLLNDDVQKQRSTSQGSTMSHITKGFLENRIFSLPPTLGEQCAISKILSDMDTDISKLEAKKLKYTAIKQGMMQQLLTGKIRLVEATTKSNATTANVYFRRSVLAAEIADRLCEEPTFGHIKMEKILFLSERLCHIDTGSHYHRDAAGPYDNKALRSIDSQLKKQKWFEVMRTEKWNRYVPMQNRGKHKTYFDKYYSDVLPTFDKIIETFKTQNTERCEIVATLYSAWEDLLHSNKPFTDADIVNEVLNNWHESKKRISQDRWLSAIQWMRENGFAPKV